MNLGRNAAPPVNNALLPDIYSKLDAETIQKTRVANTVLNIRLGVEQRVISKYRREAERMLKSQKENAVADLSRIAQKLPSTLAEPRLDSNTPHSNRCQKGYLMGRNEEAICHRCYIHHLPLKKKYYTDEPAPSTVQPRLLGHTLPQLPEGVASGVRESHTPSASSRNGVWETSRAATEIKYEISKDKVIAPIEKYKFLERDLCGRDRDLNNTLTPRLIPYEQWKTVVKNVCSQCKREIQVTSGSPLSRRSGFSRERTRGRSRERKNASREFMKTRRNSRASTPFESAVALSRKGSMLRETSDLSVRNFRKNSSRSVDHAHLPSSSEQSSRLNSRAPRKYSGLPDKLANEISSALLVSQSEKPIRPSPTAGFHSERSRSTLSMHKE